MGRIIGVDFGLKRVGLSVTDPLQIIVSPLFTVSNEKFHEYLDEYLHKESVEKIVFGKPQHSDGNDTYLVPLIEAAVKKISSKYPDIIIDYQDEYNSSNEAKKILIETGVRKKKRRDKTLIDKISAVLILQKYLNHI